jgi:hypothetical protein
MLIGFTFKAIYAIYLDNIVSSVAGDVTDGSEALPKKGILTLSFLK